MYVGYSLNHFLLQRCSIIHRCNGNLAEKWLNKGNILYVYVLYMVNILWYERSNL